MTIHHFFHEIKTKGYDVLDVNVFHHTLMRLHRKKRIIRASYNSFHCRLVEQSYIFSFKPLILC